MNDQMTAAPADPLSVRVSTRPDRPVWFVWDSFAEKRVSNGYATREGAEAALASLKIGGRA